MQRKHQRGARSRHQQSFANGQYEYEQLADDEIRVLVLYPGKLHDPLTGTLEIRCLHDLPKFRAISYCWGHRPVFSRTLFLPFGRLKTTKTLYQCLRTFRHHSKPVRLWADAICIDQSSTKERSNQVALMGQVYRQAREVMVWLGDATPPDALAFWAMHFLSDFVNRNVIDLDMMAGGLRPSEQAKRDRNLHIRGYFFRRVMQGPLDLCCPCCKTALTWCRRSLTEALNALTSIWQRPWFGRLWVIQEVALARSATFFCGPHRAKYDVVFPAAKLHQSVCDVLVDSSTIMEQNQRYSSAVSYLLREVILTWRIGKPVCPRSQLVKLLTLTATGKFSVTEPRDQVYAIRAVSGLAKNRDLQPDYNMPLEEVWTRVAVSILTPALNATMNAAVVFGFVGTQYISHSPKLPSWVPDMERLEGQAISKMAFYSYESLLQSAGGPTSELDVAFNPGQPAVLRVRGMIFSRVSKVLAYSQRPSIGHTTSIISHQDFRREIKDLLVPWYMYCRDFAFSENTVYQNLANTFGNLLVQGSDVARWFEPRGKELTRLCELLAIRTRRRYKFLEHVQVDTARMPSDLAPFLTPDLSTHFLDSKRVLAFTASGHIGWVPEGVELDDCVCLIQGAPFPFIIRELDDGNYCMLGDAYIHGIEHGEAWCGSQTAVDIYLK